MEPNFTLEKSFFESADGKNRIAYYIFSPKIKTIAILQFSHGMCEHIMRYEHFAAYLANCGIALCGNEHLGHGHSAANDEDLGFTSKKRGAEYILRDLTAMTDIAKKAFPDTPVFLLGHSMGSFYARAYAAEYGKNISGLILSGTAGDNSPTGLARILARLNILIFGARNRSKTLYRLSNGSYAKKFPKGSSKLLWISGDEAVQEAYAKDKFCTFHFTAAAYKDMFDTLHKVSKRSFEKAFPPYLSVLLVSGDRDPVGGFGKGVRRIHDRIKEAGVADVTLKLYEGGHHEMLNETDRHIVYEDISGWIIEKSGV